MDPAVLAIAFGEPPEPDRDVVVDYLEGIFLENMAIEGEMAPDRARERAHELAARRAPGLLAEYEAIGGSPLQAHLEGHVDRLEAELADRGFDVDVYPATQYHEPTVGAAVDRLADAGHDPVAVLPLYPLCGPSTTVKALASAADAIADHDGWAPAVTPIGGWHRHPRYIRLRADNVRSFCEREGIDLDDPETGMVFSAHGTPTTYLEAGSRYDRYVEEFCAAQAGVLGLPSYTLGYQNHGSRGVEWTEPDIEAAIETVEADRIVVDPVSFVHEQSETLSELDVELAGEAEALGLSFARVPVPHDDPALAAVLADLVEPAVAGVDDVVYGFRPCRCADTPGTRCLCSPVAE